MTSQASYTVSSPDAAKHIATALLQASQLGKTAATPAQQMDSSDLIHMANIRLLLSHMIHNPLQNQQRAYWSIQNLLRQILQPGRREEMLQHIQAQGSCLMSLFLQTRPKEPTHAN